MSCHDLMSAVTLDARDQGISPWWARLFSTPASGLYGGVVALRRALYDAGILKSTRLPGKTIAIGNIVAGGSGKSPLTVLLAELLLERGLRPAILTRGYGSDLRADDSLALLGGEICMAPRQSARLPDEARMQSVALPPVPVIAGRRRVEAARRFLAEHPDRAPSHWLLDDGFQHRRLARDFDCVLLDAVRPLGNGHLLPRGPLREHPRALSRAHLIVYTRVPAVGLSDEARATVRRWYEGPTLETGFHAGPLVAVSAPGLAFDQRQHQPVLAACGIARPEFFIEQLRASGIAVGKSYVVPDHGSFDREMLWRHASSVASVVTTAKDYWRDPDIFANCPVPVFIQELRLSVDMSRLCEFLGPLLVQV